MTNNQSTKRGCDSFLWTSEADFMKESKQIGWSSVKIIKMEYQHDESSKTIGTLQCLNCWVGHFKAVQSIVHLT